MIKFFKGTVRLKEIMKNAKKERLSDSKSDENWSEDDEDSS